MSRYTQQTSWGRGEIEPKLEARQDADFYASGARRLDNFLPDTVAGIETRKGFAAFRDVPRAIATDSGTATLVRDRQNLLGYVYRDVQVLVHIGVYVADGGENHIAVTPYRVRVDRLDTENPADISVVTARGDRFISDVVTTTATSVFEVGFSTAGPAAFIAHRLLPPLRIFPDSLTADQAVFNAEEITFYQSLFGFATVENGSTTWTGTEEAFFTEQLTSGDTIKFRGQLYTVASTSEDADGVQSFTTDETYNGVTLTDRVAVQEDAPFGGENPSLVGFFQSRLVYARTDTLPTGVWLSRSNDPFTIVPSAIADDSPINAELFAEGADEFVWLTGGDRLYFGSSLGEYALGGNDETLTPTQLRFFRIGNNGGAQTTPVLVNGAVLFVNRARSQILSVVFDFGRQAFQTNNLSLLAQHLTEDVVDMAFRPPVNNDRTPRVFALTADRELRAFALSSESQVAAWSRISYSSAFTVQAIAATSEYLFVVVQRASGKVELAVLRNE